MQEHLLHRGILDGNVIRVERHLLPLQHQNHRQLGSLCLHVEKLVAGYQVQRDLGSRVGGRGRKGEVERHLDEAEEVRDFVHL